MVVTIVRYLEYFLKWAREEIKHMDHRTKKLMMMHKALTTKRWHRQTMWQKIIGKRTCQHWGLRSATIQQLKKYTKKRARGDLLQQPTTWITTDINLRTNKKTKIKKISSKQKWEEKQQYGYFIQQTEEIEMVWTWLWQWNLERNWISIDNSTK